MELDLLVKVAELCVVAGNGLMVYLAARSQYRRARRRSTLKRRSGA
jgi:hypothetical protein